MWGENLVILTPLFKKYLEMGVLISIGSWSTTPNQYLICFKMKLYMTVGWLTWIQSTTLEDRLVKKKATAPMVEKLSIKASYLIQIGIAVYAYAKLISFWKFINKYLVNGLYQLMKYDTDSLYIAFGRDSIDDCVKPELLDDWIKEKWDYVFSEDPRPIEFEEKYYSISTVG